MSKSIDVLAKEYLLENHYKLFCLTQANSLAEGLTEIFKAGYKQRSDELKDDRLFTYAQLYEAVNNFYGSDYSMPHSTLKKFIKEKFNIDL